MPRTKKNVAQCFCWSVMETKWKATKRKAGTTLIVDRYFYSGVVFASAKGIDVEWCKVFFCRRIGLLAPDLVLYLDIPLETMKMGNKSKKTSMNGDMASKEMDAWLCALCALYNKLVLQ
ncbi:hypothetical protein CUMW_065610 [Citrus unshiu]|nr:hypothetical protein CUMW_065610 [Citrus unshiu]